MSDLINRQDAIDMFQNLAYEDWNQGVVTTWANAYSKVAEFIKLLPSAQENGEWIPVTNGRGGHECNLCHNYAPSYQTGDEWLTNFCPNCGADMR